ncbi:glycosyltransferase [Flavobacterium sp. CHNK8]|uniref:glycosyltransferase n=1 Tax=Flavobacterium sp. CHNK8 TaxID=2871165 RepID=UPI001C8DCAB9|nr:glycosyltransferase [Flavobacterium sp. CHNK8]QZK89592.1 glycosyltransferase [Flavobacterium sp. CHNK8]
MNISNPLISVLIITYNQEEYIRETLAGALSQNYSPLEIIISDDCSTDSNFSIIQEVVAAYEGPHKLIVNRNNTNLGMGHHISEAFKLTRGELIVIMGGDDISTSERTTIIYKEWINSGKSTTAFFSNVQLIDKYGTEKQVMFPSTPSYTSDILTFLEKTKSSIFNTEPLCWLLGCSAAVDRKVWDVFGEIHNDVIQEDAVLAFRALLLGNIKYIDQPLVKYRRHDTNVFEPTDLKRVLHLLQREYYYKLQWYNDGVKISEDRTLIKVLKSIKIKAYIYHNFLKIPLVGISYLRLKNILKRIIR